MLKEDPTPMTTHMTGTESVLLGTQMGGDERKNIQRNAIGVSEGVPPFTDVCQRGRSILVELRHTVEGKAVEEASASLLKNCTTNGIPRRTMESRPRASAPRSKQKRSEGVIDPFRGKYVRPLRGGRVAEQKAELVAVVECHH